MPSASQLSNSTPGTGNNSETHLPANIDMAEEPEPCPVSPSSVQHQACLSTKTKTEIACDFVLASPPGEFNEILDDLKVISKEDLDLASLYQASRSRNLDRMIVVEFANVADQEAPQVQSLLTRHNLFDAEGDSDSFFDPALGIKFAVDQFSLKVSQIESFSDPHSATLDKDLVSKVNDYVKKTFPTGVSRVFGRKDGKIVIAIVGNRFRPDSFWNGHWRSEWTLDPPSGVLTGNLAILVHYFEDGNIQLNTRAENIQNTLPKFDNIISWDALIEGIQNKEDEIQLGLNEAYHQLGESTFKKLRRQLPVTRSKLDWAKLATYKLGDEIASHQHK